LPNLFSISPKVRRRFLWVALVLACGVWLVRSNAFWNALSPVTQKSLLYELAGTYKIDPLLLAAIIRSESTFWPFAESRAGAMGLMQLLPSTAEEEARLLNLDYQDSEDLYRNDINLRLGTHYFSRVLKSFDGNLVLGLAAYNAGVGKVRSWKLQSFGRDQDSLVEDIPVRETRRYVQRVLAAYRHFKLIQKIKRALQGLE
jgi:soluble lytic murein transglycosylase